MLLEQYPHPLIAVHRTAVQWGKPPSFWLGGNESWTAHDKMFVHAFNIYQSRLCATCGNPPAVCESGHWSVELSVCGPEAAVQKWHKENKDNVPGQKVTPIESVVEVAQSAAAATAPAWVREKFGA